MPWIKGSDTGAGLSQSPRSASAIAHTPTDTFFFIVSEREFILFAGWRRDLRDVLLLLDAMCVGGSEIHIMASVALSDRDRLLADGGLEVETLRNIKLVHHVGNTAQRRHLELLNIGQFTSVIVFADETEEGDIMQSDSKVRVGAFPNPPHTGCPYKTDTFFYVISVPRHVAFNSEHPKGETRGAETS